jgi:hypothetical protein
MPDNDVRSWGGRVVGFAGSLLLAAVLLYLAVGLLQCIWVWLIIIAIVVVGLGIAIWWLRRRKTYW